MTRPTSLGTSTFWRISETLGNEFVSFGVFVMLARLLAPADFGSVALAGAIMVLMQAVLYHGSTDSLIQLAGCERRHSAAALAANLRLAAAMVLVAAVAAWPIALLLDRPEFAHILWTLLPSLLLRSLCAPMLAALRRQMDFRSIALRTLLGVAAGGLIAMVMAHSGFGAWSLVAQQWIGELVGFAVLTIASPVKPWSARWDRRSLDELLPVALPVMGAQLSNNAARRLDTFAVETQLGHQAVGIYFMAYRLVLAVQMVTQHGLGDVSLVVLSRHAGDAAARNAAVLRLLGLAMLPTGLAFGLLALLAPCLLPLLFGSAWAAAVDPVMVLAALAPAGALVALMGVSLVAAGQAQAFKRLSIGTSLAQLAMIFAAAPWGLVAVSFAIGAAQLLAVPLAAAVLRRSLGITAGELLRSLAPMTLLYAVSLVVGAWSVGSVSAGWPSVVFGSAAFAVLMLGIGLVMARPAWRALSGSWHQASTAVPGSSASFGSTTSATNDRLNGSRPAAPMTTAAPVRG